MFEQREIEQRAKEAEFKEVLDQEKDEVREKAKVLKMLESERVRELNSAIQYSKVIKERDEQLDINQAKKE